MLSLNSIQLEIYLHSEFDDCYMISGLCVSLLSLICVCETSLDIRGTFVLNRIDHSLIGIFLFKLITRVHAGAEPGGAKKETHLGSPLNNLKTSKI